MTKPSSFFENSRNSTIHGASFVHSENRVTQRRENVFHAPIHGYMHTAANVGPVIAYYNHVSVESDVGRGGQRSPSPGLYQREHDVSLIENGSAIHSDIVHDEPEPITLADMRISEGGGGRSLGRSAEPRIDSLPLELEDEFKKLSQEMQEYIKYLMNRRNSAGDQSPMVLLDLPKRGARTFVLFPSHHDQRLSYATSPGHEAL